MMVEYTNLSITMQNVISNNYVCNSNDFFYINMKQYTSLYLYITKKTIIRFRIWMNTDICSREKRIRKYVFAFIFWTVGLIIQHAKKLNKKQNVVKMKIEKHISLRIFKKSHQFKTDADYPYPLYSFFLKIHIRFFQNTDTDLDICIPSIYILI